MKLIIINWNLKKKEKNCREPLRFIIKILYNDVMLFIDISSLLMLFHSSQIITVLKQDHF